MGYAYKILVIGKIIPSHYEIYVHRKKDVVALFVGERSINNIREQSRSIVYAYFVELLSVMQCTSVFANPIVTSVDSVTHQIVFISVSVTSSKL